MKIMIKGIVAMLLLAGVAHAETHNGTLTLSPAVVTLRGTYGQSTTQRVSMANGTSQMFACDVVVQDVIVREVDCGTSRGGAGVGGCRFGRLCGLLGIVSL